MIDLHMHTKYSDGTDNIKQILINCEKANLDIISITDHNSCEVYFELEGMNIKKYFSGSIIVGCEFTTSYQGKLIEVLGYGFDYYKINEYLKKYYSMESIKKNTSELYNRLISKIEQLNLSFDKTNIRESMYEKEFFEREIYDEIISHKKNFEILDEDILKSFSDFFRKGLTNIESKLFINHAEFKPDLKEIINIVHENNGIIFLAHPYQYKHNDIESFIEKLYDEFKFDGVECFYTTFFDEQTNNLIKFAEKRNLLISGGSDYHGTNKELHDIGIGSGNLKINNEIINSWKIEFYI